MKKNKYINLRLLVTGVLILTGILSCEDLDEGSKGAILAEGFYVDAQSLEPGIKGIYGTLQRAIWGVDVLAAYTGADDLTTHPGGNKWVFREGDQFDLSGGNQRTIRIWNEYYRTIHTCNSFILNARPEKVEETVLNNAHANAHFIRGLMYFRLATIFGDIPMPLHPDPEFKIEKTPKREVIEQVIQDFKFAEKWIINDRDKDASVVDGRITKTASKAFIAKTYMQLTGWPYTETDKWDSVKKYTKEIIDAGVYSLVDDYAHNFGLPWENNREVIWAHQFKREGWPIDTESRWYGAVWQNWMDMFLEWNFYRNFPKGYRRQCSATDDTLRSKYVNEYAHPVIMKLNYGTIKDSAGYEHTWRTSNDVPVMRYAEVLLMYAEACANTNEMQEGIDHLNLVRRRAYAGGATNSGAVESLGADFWKNPEPIVDLTLTDFAGTGSAALVDSIVKERAYEFIVEVGGNRWLDLIRLERVGQANANRDTIELDLIGDPNDKTRWFAPIPDTEIGLNENLK